MRKLFDLLKGEKGLSLPIVLGVLAVGSVLIVPCLHYTGTTLISVRNQEVKNQGIFAADAGIENAIWHIRSDSATIPTALPEPVNGMTVNIQAINRGEYVLYNGTLVTAGSHNTYSIVMSQTIVPAGSGKYRFTISVWKTATATGNVKLAGVGAKLPLGYQYVTNSAGNATNVSPLEPVDVTDAEGAHLLNWRFDIINMAAGYIYTETFLITGSGSLSDYYAWADASRQDAGEIGEFFGEVYEITATASQGTNVIATVEAKVMKTFSNPVIVSWRPQ